MPGPDEIDRQLIRELQSDARQSNVALAQKVGLTEGAVRRRIDNLLKTGEFRIVAIGDPELLGLRTHAVIGIRADMNRLEDLSAELTAMRELSYVYETTGQYDIMIVGFFASNEQLREFLTRKLAKVEGVISMDTFLVMRTVKRSFRWGEAVDDELPPPSTPRRPRSLAR
ncbi:MAG: Lrp/AsnC family transcriptional regulator [Chloroflexota bacterium]|nr:Lrp/AsnC family transcriptional regulator [Chloroflexota bacterium]